MKSRIIFIHGNQSTHWSFAWAPWLKIELEKLGHETFFEFETMPDSIIARGKYWLPFMKEHIKIGENDVIVGWSSGAVAAMRYAEEVKIKGSILIAPCCTDLGDEMEKQSGYYESPWSWNKIKENQEKIFLVHSDNDPFIPQSEFETILENLKPKEIVIKNGKHFIEQDKFDEVLEIIKNNF
jgi:uncharacterized protein